VHGSVLLATTIAIRGATLVDGTGAPPVPNALLVVSGGRIVSVGVATPDALRALPAGTQVVAAEGEWIVPGFVDAHVHAESEEDLRAMLRWGVTSARLMAEDVGEARALAKASGSRTDIPQLFPAAPIFTTKGGWWDEGMPRGAGVDRFPSTPAEARAAVKDAKALGAAEIKLMVDDMAWCRAPKPALKKMSPEVLGALIGEARAGGLRAIVHAPNLADARAAVEAGATALAHGVLEPFDDATLAKMKSGSVYYVPTMDIFEFLADTRGFMDSVLSDPAAVDGLPAATVERYRAPEYARGYAERYANFDDLRRRLPALRENLRRLHAAGVPVALGTDMWAFPGLGVSIEMDLYAKAGLAPLEVIRTATETAARSMGVENDRGSLSKGKRADFVRLRADPLTDLRNSRKIREVWKSGQPVWTAPKG
jgi:imidazolonepropionase-like amidohydrolase